MPDRRLRRREQNRQAARRCRQRKKEQGQELIKVCGAFSDCAFCFSLPWTFTLAIDVRRYSTVLNNQTYHCLKYNAAYRLIFRNITSCWVRTRRCNPDWSYWKRRSNGYCIFMTHTSDLASCSSRPSPRDVEIIPHYFESFVILLIETLAPARIALCYV